MILGVDLRVGIETVTQMWNLRKQDLVVESSLRMVDSARERLDLEWTAVEECGLVKQKYVNLEAYIYEGNMVHYGHLGGQKCIVCTE